MKCLHSLVFGLTFLQVFWISVSNGQDDPGAAINCSTVTEKSECCGSQSTCVYVNCTSDGKSVSRCYASLDDATCESADEKVNSCGSDATTPAKSGNEEEENKDEGNEEEEKQPTEAPTEGNTVDCSKHASSKNECCTAGESACAFFTCTAADGEVFSTNCVAADAELKCEGDSTAGANSCTAEETPETPESAPDETPEEVDCTTFNGNQTGCCSAGESAACIFFNCTNENDEVTASFCAAADSTPKCAVDNDTPSANICTGSGASGTTPSGKDGDDASQSGGKDSSGQQFDAASFIGGIVLCAGLLAIAFFGIKYYRSRQDRHYESM